MQANNILSTTVVVLLVNQVTAQQDQVSQTEQPQEPKPPAIESNWNVAICLLIVVVTTVLLHIIFDVTYRTFIWVTKRNKERAELETKKQLERKI